MLKLSCFDKPALLVDCKMSALQCSIDAVLIYWSPCLARSHYCQQLTLSVCPSVCHAPSNRFFFFVSQWNRSILWLSVLHVALYETLFFDFWFRSPDAQNLLPKICTKSPITWLVWQIDRTCLGRFNGTMQNVVGRPLLPWQRNLGKARRSSRLPACCFLLFFFVHLWP